MRWSCVTALGGLVLLGLAAPGVASATCAGGQVLTGSYSLNVAGANTSGVPKYLSGVVSFNGACAISGTALVGEPGVPAAFNASVTGSYAQNADGTVSLSLNLPNVSAAETYVVYISQISGDALGEETDPSAVATIGLKPQVAGKNPPLSYSNTTLQGQWTASCRGAAGSFSDLNVFSGDGNGNLVNGIDDSNNNAQFFDEPYTGTYAVQANGVVTGNVTVAGSVYDFAGAVSTNGNVFDYVYTTPTANPQAFIGCTAERVAPASTFSCHVSYQVTSSWPGAFQASVAIGNTGTTAISSWTLAWSFPSGQQLLSVWNGNASQSGANVSISNLGYNGYIPAGGSYSGLGFIAFAGKANNPPSQFTVNGVTCH
jgi:hypothetical protein